MSEIDENVITKDDAEIINEYLMEAFKDEAVENIQPDWNELYEAAQKFIFTYNNLERMIHNKNLVMRKKMLQMDAMSSNFIAQKESSEDTYLRRAQFIAAFKFDKTLTKFRGQSQRLALIVHYDEENQEIHQLKIPLEVLALYSRGKKGAFDINQITFFELRKEYEDLNKENGQTKHQEAARAAFIGTSLRLNRFFETLLKSDKRASALLMWNLSKNNPKTWVVARVNGFGDVKEAYIAAFYATHKSSEDKLWEDDISPGSSGYYNDALIASFFYYIQRVTNLAAIREEDVVTESSQYAVKSTAAHLPRINQYVKVANMIVSQDSFLNQSQLEEKIQELYPMDAERNVIIMEGNKLVRKNVNENILSWLKENTHLKMNI